MDMKIIGIAGLPRSGKDSLAELFMEKGFFGLSFGDVVRDFARERHKDKPNPISVENLTETANWLRQNRGADVILQEALRQFEAEKAAGNNYRGLVLFSVRAPVEADFILDHGGELIWVESSDEVRHHRAMQSLREGEAEVSLAEFKRQEDLQWQPQPGIPAEVQMNVAYVKQKATRVMENNGDDFDEFKRNAQKLIEEIA